MVVFYSIKKHDCFTLLFFFQAEDGIRYRNVTGVQTCALPICSRSSGTAPPPRPGPGRNRRRGRARRRRGAGRFSREYGSGRIRRAQETSRTAVAPGNILSQVDRRPLQIKAKSCQDRASRTNGAPGKNHERAAEEKNGRYRRKDERLLSRRLRRRFFLAEPRAYAGGDDHQDR